MRFKARNEPIEAGKSTTPMIGRTFLVLIIFNLLIGVVALWKSFDQKKIAYVRSGEIIYGYIGMKESQSTFKDKTQAWQSNIDTLQSEYYSAIEEYNRIASHLSAMERMEQEEKLKKQEDNLLQYKQAIELHSKEEEGKMSQGVLNQINSFVEEYGKQHGYDIILGTTMSGSVLYGNEAMDITKEVLHELNKTYQKK